MKYPDYIQELIRRFSQFPSVGPKAAERYVFYLLQQSPADLQALSTALAELPFKAKRCSQCGAYSEAEPCSLCADTTRSTDILCIVLNSQDMAVIENTKQFSGRYFLLGRLLNTIEDVGPDKLPINALRALIKKNGVKELILALNFTLEGESTALYLKKIFPELKITRLARGLPAGSDLEYADELTLANALKYRNNI